MKICIAFVSLLNTTLIPAASSAQEVATPFIDSTDQIPANWNKDRFKLSHAYPPTPPVDSKPWKEFQFKTQPKEYILAALKYALEGNAEVKFDVANNAVRKWYHAPGMVRGASGREFIHGLTRERPIALNDLKPGAPPDPLETWAVSIYNPVGGYTIGQVWQNPNHPDPAKARFSDGAVSLKLLFTTATKDQLDYLEGAPEWEANIRRNLNQVSTPPPTVRLLQVDIAIRESGADDTTGWVFGTFAYRHNATEPDPWKRLVPIGVMWGNDTGLLTQAQVDAAGGLKETWLNTSEIRMSHYGYLGRLNGPVDNPRSSCLSCHGTASFPQGDLAPQTNSPAENKRFFQNIKAGAPVEGKPSLDYSLQLSFGIRNFPGDLLPVQGDRLRQLMINRADPGDLTPRDGRARLDDEARRILELLKKHSMNK